MNSSALLLSQIEPPFYMIIGQYFVLPLVLGNVIDMVFGKFIGSQNCSFDGVNKVCSIAGQKVPSYVREFGRSFFQLVLVFLVLKYVSAYFKNTIYPVAGITIFILAQSDLFEDFRRFINSLLFMIKHN